MQKSYKYIWLPNLIEFSYSYANYVKNKCAKPKKKLCNCGANYIKIITLFT